MTFKHQVESVCSVVAPMSSEAVSLERTSEQLARDKMAADGSLGSYTKSFSPSLTSDRPETLTRWAFREQKFTLQNSIRALIMAENGFSKGEVLDIEEYNKLHRVVKCARTRISPYVSQYATVKDGRSHYGGLAACGSVWGCPVCAAKIQAKRRAEIEHCINFMADQGKKPVFITLTFPHYAWQSCAQLLEAQASTLAKLRSGKAWQSFKSRVGFDSLIRSLEITYGSNGWHPHTHELWFVDQSIDENEIYDYLVKRWFTCCDKNGLIKKGKKKAFMKHSVKLGFSKSDYLAKLDSDKYTAKLAAEVSLSSVKHGRSDSLHPFQLASLAYDNRDKMAAKLFNEYLESMHGKRQLFFSNGLKKRSGLADKTDKVLAEEQTEKSTELIRYEMFAWNVILKENARAYMLSLYESQGIEAIYKWLDSRGLCAYGIPDI